MILEKLSLKSFRNINELYIEPCSDVNVIYGDNAQGKTNLLESIWLLTGSKSFRGSKDNQLISFESDTAEISAGFFSQGRPQTIDIRVNRNQKRKKVLLNNVPQESCANLGGAFSAVVFSPSHLSLIKDGPSFRRRFMDNLLCRISPVYLKNMLSYQRILDQRNALLKYDNIADMSQLELWSRRLCDVGAKIISQRFELIAKIAPEASKIYNGISSDRERFDISYDCGIIKNPEGIAETAAAFEKKLNEMLKSDIQCRTTQCGPHRDDLNITVDGIDAKSFGSQGQQRSCVISMKLAECSVLENYFGEKPVILLDDVLSELDSVRQTFILNYVNNMQVFITCCDKSFFDYLSGGMTFKIKDGKIEKQD